MKNRDKTDNLITDSENVKPKKNLIKSIVLLVLIFVLLVTVVGFSFAWIKPNEGVSQIINSHDVDAVVVDGNHSQLSSDYTKNQLQSLTLVVHNKFKSSVKIRVKLLFETKVGTALLTDPTYQVAIATDASGKPYWEYRSDGYYYYIYDDVATEKDEYIPFVSQISVPSELNSDATIKIVALTEVVQPDRADEFF